MTLTNKVAYCKITFAHIGEVDFTKDLDIPIVYEPVLDETLDTAVIHLSDLRKQDYSVDVSKAFEPFSLVRIGFVGQTTEIRMVIAHDECKQKRKDNTPWKSWSHTIELVEETKRLERESVDVLTFTNPVERDYTDGTWTAMGAPAQINPLVTKEKKEVGSATHTLHSVNYAGMIYIPSFAELHGYEYVGWGTPISSGSYNEYVVSNHILVYKEENYKPRSINNSLESFEKASGSDILYDTWIGGGAIYNLPQGDYVVEYLILMVRKSGSAVYDSLTGKLNRENETETRIGVFWETYEIAMVDKNNASQNYTIADLLNRTLNLTPTRTKGEANKFKFDAAQLTEYAQEEAPEFAFTGHTLFEAMLLVAQYKGSFPELVGDTISFRELWNGVTLTEADLPPAIDEANSSDINQYCTYLETEVQNLVGVNDSRVATVIEPYRGGYKTTRSGGGSEISEDTALIATTYSMYQSIAVDMGYTNGEEIGNITPYIYEQGEYASLSDTSSLYPLSKAYAIEWKQMGKNYTELSHRVTTSASSIAQAFTKPVIANIVRAKTGKPSNDALIQYLAGLAGYKLGDSFADLMFRTEYVPLLKARIKQYKDYFGEFHFDGSIKYNQTAELVDSEMYGEHLKQLIRKIGNATKYAIYIFDTIDEVPKVGTVMDGYSIYDVKMSIRENEVVATIFFVKYAELSQYVGIKNPWKDSDISVDKCYNRAISRNEFLLFTYDSSKKSTSSTLSTNALRGIMQFTSAAPLTCVEATGYMSGGEELNTVLLPVVPLAVGNSLFFQWGYEDNYSAGYMSEKAPDGATNAISGTQYNRAQKAVRYCDMYGRMETYDFSIMPTGPVPNGSNMAWVEEETVETEKDVVARKIGYSLPMKPSELCVKGASGYYTSKWQGEPYISVKNLYVDKNSSEALTFSVQLHYCSDNENFIVGSGLTNFCSLIGGAAQEIALYGFKERLNIFNRRIILGSNATRLTIPTFSVSSASGKVTISLPSTINSYLAWALLGKDKNGNYQIIFGENRDLAGSDFKTGLYLLPMKKLEDFI